MPERRLTKLPARAIVTHDSFVAGRAQRTGLMNHGQLAIRPDRPTLAT
jgi:predicted ABC-type transport system involved in lysophospholipase L1 biosynthesis ATPase subunit